MKFDCKHEPDCKKIRRIFGVDLVNCRAIVGATSLGENRRLVQLPEGKHLV